MKNDKLTLKLATLVAMVVAAETAMGACTRSDVDYYLAQGFTRDQVVALCTGKPVGNTTPAASRPETSGLVQTTNEPSPRQAMAGELRTRPSPNGDTQARAAGTDAELEDFLKSTIDGYDVQLSEQALHYTRKTCIEYGPRNHEFGIKTEACPDVRYTLTRTGLSVKSVKQAFLILGNLEVTVSGRIERKILALDHFRPEVRGPIQAHLENGAETMIPIRDGVSEARLEAALRSLPL